MPEHFDAFPAATVDQLRAQLTAYPGCQLKVWHEAGHAFLQVLPARVGGAVVATASAPSDPAPLDDSFPCPGSPGCPS